MNAEIISSNQPVVIPRATHGSPDHPLRLGDLAIPCYVLEDGRRVLQQGGMLSSLNMSYGGSYSSGGDRLAKFASQTRLKDFISSDLIDRTAHPIRFRTPRGGVANGYEAVILADLCDAILAARRDGKLMKQQMHIAERAEILIRGFAKLGIIAVIDEITGYQESRDRDALHQLLEKYMTAERLAWTKRFPDPFFKEMFRLRGWQWPIVRGRTNRMVGHLINRFVYDRLPPGVLGELQRRNPPSEETKRRRYRHHQFLSEDFGQQDLRNHLLQLLPIMRISPDWESFERNFEAAFPDPGTPAEVLELMSLEEKRKAKK